MKWSSLKKSGVLSGCKALSNERRLQILFVLSAHPSKRETLEVLRAEVRPCALVTFRYHIHVLEEAGFVEVTKSRGRNWVRLLPIGVGGLSSDISWLFRHS